MTAPVPPLSSPDVLREAGIITSQLETWLRRGLISPLSQARPGSGNSRQWPPEVIPAARLLGRLTRAGLDLKAAGMVLRSGESRCEIAPGIVIEVTDG